MAHPLPVGLTQSSPGGSVAATSSSAGVRIFYRSTSGQLTMTAAAPACGPQTFGSPQAIDPSAAVPTGATLAAVAGLSGTANVIYFAGSGAIYLVTNRHGPWEHHTFDPEAASIAGGRVRATAIGDSFDLERCGTMPYHRTRLIPPPQPPGGRWSVTETSVASDVFLDNSRLANAVGISP